MKRIFTHIQKSAKSILLLTVLAGAMASCDSILDFEEGDCSIEYRVKFRYDYNMEKVDAFAQEVKTVTLYAFDKDGNFVYQKTEQGERLAHRRLFYASGHRTRRLRTHHMGRAGRPIIRRSLVDEGGFPNAKTSPC